VMLKYVQTVRYMYTYTLLCVQIFIDNTQVTLVNICAPFEGVMHECKRRNRAPPWPVSSP
jgi:hypothetical protein